MTTDNPEHSPIEYNGKLTMKEVVDIYNSILKDYQQVTRNYENRFFSRFRRTMEESDQRTLEDSICTLLRLGTQEIVKKQREDVRKALGDPRGKISPAVYDKVEEAAQQDTLSERSTMLAQSMIRYLGTFNNTGIRTFKLPPVKYDMPKDPTLLKLLGLGEGTELGEQLKRTMDDKK